MPLTRESNACLPAGGFPCPGAIIVPPRSWRLALVGPPDAVNSLLTAQLAQALGVCALFTSQDFRDSHAACAGTSAALAEWDSCMAEGCSVEDGVMLLLLRQSRACLRCKRGFLLENVPRTLTQARAVDALLAADHLSFDGVIYYELSDDDEHAGQLAKYSTSREHRIRNSATSNALCENRHYEMLSVVEHYRVRGLLFTVRLGAPAPDTFARTLDLLASLSAPSPPSG